MGRFYDLSSGPLPRVAVPPTFTYLGGEMLDNATQRRAVATLSFRGADRQTYELQVAPLDATHRFPSPDPRPTMTTAGGRGYKENRGTQGIVGLSFVDRRFTYVVHRPLFALLAAGTLVNAEVLVDSVDVVE